jgi:hypothetical protein
LENKGSSMQKQTQPLIIVESNPNGLDIEFNPDRDVIKEAIEDAIMKGVAVVCNNDLLLSAPEFEKYMQPLEEFDDK